MKQAIRFTRWLALALCALWLTVSVAHAQDPTRTQAFVYGITNYNGAKYASAIVPPSVDTMYLLAGRENVVAPRETLIYWWPITNEYLADWDRLNQVVDGTLNVYQNGRLFKSFPLSSYVIQYDVNNPADTLALYTGAEAQAKYEAWSVALKNYQDALSKYYAALSEWDIQIEELRKSSPNGVIPPEKVPPQPQQPKRPTLLSTNLAQGFVIDLPSGTFTIEIARADGSIQPDSRKQLVMFDKLRDGIAYSVVPSTRWNLPEQSDEPESVIYAEPGTTLYLQAFQAGQYDDYAYSHMLDPQNQSAQAGRAKWVSFDPTTQPQMHLTSGGVTVQQIPSQPYYVQQVSGGGLGYQVEPFDPSKMERATFTGYTIPLDVSGTEYSVQLVDANGTPLAGSQRRIIALNADRVWMPYVLSALPLALGVGVLVWRRRQARRVKVDE
ncbi:MAG TPA: hypothetical protein VFD70_14645 [Anaerolineae bacterium]|nr:hypothetical protein [Anaerolineae bacterium]